MRTERIARVGVLLVAMTAMTLGCRFRTVAWTYTPTVHTTVPSPLLGKTVAVPPFADARPDSNYNLTMLCLLPVIPCGWQKAETPEGVEPHGTSMRWVFKPSEDFAKAMAAELERAGFFQKVFFTYRPNEGDLVLQGKIVSTKYKWFVLTYGLGFMGAYAWLVGAPVGWTSSRLELEMTLKDSKSGAVIWQNAGQGKKGKPYWIYYQPSDFYFDNLFAKIARDLVDDLGAKLRARPTGQ